MTLYVITRVSVDQDGWIQEAYWMEYDSQLDQPLTAARRVRPDDLLRAMDGPDTVNFFGKGESGTFSAWDLVIREETPEGHRLRLRKHDENAQHRIELYSL